MIELLVVLALVAIVAALAAPSMQETSARAEVKSAAENISHAVRLAKNTARSTGQPVTVTVTTATTGNSISFVDISGTAFDFSTTGIRLPPIQLPSNISVVAAQVAFTFDSMGKIVNFDQLTTIVLKSTVVSSHALTVSIVNNLGYITTKKGLADAGTA